MRTTALLFFSLLFAAPAPLPQTSAPRAYLGFDRNDYPGDAAMPILRKSFSFTGYWLGPPPGENSNSWSGKRDLLRSQGFGFALLFAGPTAGQLRDDPYTLKRVAEDTQTASAAARREGFPPGSIIFLDVEEGGRLPSTYFTYLKLWASELSSVRSSVPRCSSTGFTTTPALLRPDVLSRKILRPLRRAALSTRGFGSSSVLPAIGKLQFAVRAMQKTATATLLAIQPIHGFWTSTLPHHPIRQTGTNELTTKKGGHWPPYGILSAA